MGTKLDKNYEAVFKEMVDAVYSHLPNRDLTAFLPQISSSFRPGVDWLYVGQAVNGWGDKNDQGPRFGRGRPPRFDRIRGYSDNGGDITYVERYTKTAFWQVIRWLVAGENWKKGWSNRVAWSNLYKVAPWDGGNPDNVLCAAQFAFARDLLHREVQTLRPACVVVLGGIDWYEGFFELTAKEHQYLSNGGERPAVGVTRIGRTPVVLAPHPQSAFRRSWDKESLGKSIRKASQRARR